MYWLRSRRFYLGLVIGLLPLLFVAAQQSVSTPPETGGDTIVRTYDTCPDELSIERTAALVEMLPPHGVLVETFSGCGGSCAR